MPEAFQFPYGAASVLRGAMAEARVDVWIAEYRPLRGRLSRLVARLKPGATQAAAAAEIAAVEARRQSLTAGPQRLERASVVPYADAVLGPARRSLWLLFAAVSLVLIAACANVANLLLALTGTRMQEVATRAALGASRGRLARQFLIESLMLALAGGLAGVIVARWTTNLLIAFGAQRIPRMHEVSFDWTVFAFLLLVCVATALFFGVAPALTAGRVDAGLLAKGGGRTTAGRGYGRVRDALVVAEVALAFVLASGATVVISEMERLRDSDNGMTTENVLTFHLGQPMAQGIESQYYDIAWRVGQIPGVQAAGFTQVLPLQNWGWTSSSTDFFVRGTAPRREAPFPIELRYVTPGYFQALGIQLRGGRNVEASDTAASPRVIVINETLARTYFGAADPVGVEMNRGRIVGVVRDVRQVGLDKPAVPEIYFPMAQNWSQVADLGMTLVVRTAGNPYGVIDGVRGRVSDVNPRIAIFNVRTMEQVVSDSLWNLNLYRWLMGWFAALTLMLSAAGLYGVVAHSVTSRRREWAVRLALGSAPADVTRKVLVRGITLAAIGVSAGIALVSLAVRSFGSEFPAQAASAGGWTLTVVAVLMLAIALAASWLPSVRAARIAPAAVLRARVGTTDGRHSAIRPKGRACLHMRSVGHRLSLPLANGLPTLPPSAERLEMAVVSADGNSRPTSRTLPTEKPNPNQELEPEPGTGTGVKVSNACRPRPHQALRRADGGRTCLVRSEPGRGVRVARSERIGQEHDGQNSDGAARALERPCRTGWPRCAGRSPGI